MGVYRKTRLVGDSIGDSVGDSIGNSAGDGVVDGRGLVDHGVVGGTRLVGHCIVTGASLVGLLARFRICSVDGWMDGCALRSVGVNEAGLQNIYIFSCHLTAL